MSASDGNTAELWVPTGSVTVRVPGKVNLYLAVGDRREDGYHELTTVFHAVSLVDEVTVRNADVLSLELVGEGADQLPTDERNLAWQAAELMAEHVGRAPDVSIMIDKSIPVAGGMAGGSADAAAVLVAMNSLWELNVPRRDLRMLAARLGSDVPFALHGGTALGTGRGEELATVLSRNTFHWVLAFADSGLLTSAVYNELDRLREVGDPPRLGEPGPVLAALAAGDPDQLAPLLGNEMQAAAVSLDPALARALRAGVEAGALAGIVSGSGPTVCLPVHLGELGDRCRRAAVGGGSLSHRSSRHRAGTRRPRGVCADRSVTEFLGACLGRPGVSARAEAGGSIGWRTSMPAVGPQASALARSVARIKARRKSHTMMRQSRSARASATGQLTAIAASTAIETTRRHGNPRSSPRGVRQRL
ncbi:4-diphosphocytidyl-2-C-methyl-D-erythritol kinase [Mycobacterium tuberculosis CAS/NITR204]|uniref:4-diphosphocytidyl-2-C-methyl-D-erythritol kinase n=2 Tax=Mycobacterium tuberculosis TaxID=1773 RepID=R4MEZ0_MYCTX|nr:4-diphosphocytidyl-2-C-methyl-D-erythritol kinase [Mycobacterium tuberculosis CAS/NITR204]